MAKQFINYHEKSIGAAEIAKAVEKSDLIKKLKVQTSIQIIGLSSEHGVDISLPGSECAFRKVLAQKGYTVARKAEQTEGSIGLSINMRKNRKADAEKVVLAYLLYKNNKLVDPNGELIS